MSKPRRYTEDKLKKFAEIWRANGNKTKAYIAVFGNTVSRPTTQANRLTKAGTKTAAIIEAHINELNNSAEERLGRAEAIAKGDEIAAFFSRVMRNEEKDAFGIDLNIDARLKAAENLAKINQMYTQNINLTTTQVQIIDDMSGDSCED